MKKIPTSEIRGNPATIIAPSGTIIADPVGKTLAVHDGVTPGGTSIGGGGRWGTITGILSSQTDLQSVLDTKAQDFGNVTANTDTTLVAVAHANRPIIITGNNSPILTFQTDAAGGFTRQDVIVVCNLGTGVGRVVAGAGATVTSYVGENTIYIGPGRSVVLSCASAANTAVQIGGMQDGYFYSGTWANRPTAFSNGHRAWITDIGGGTEWRWDNTELCWRPSGIIELRAVYDAPIAAPVTAGDQTVVAWCIQLPVGVCQRGTRIDAWSTFSKSGTTDAFATTRIRIGNAAAVAGTQLTSTNAPATQRLLGTGIAGVRFTSATAFTTESSVAGQSVNAPTTGALTANQPVFFVPTTGGGTTDTISLEQHCIRIYPRGM